MTTAKKMIQVAASYIGISGTDNIFNTWYYGYHCYDEDKYPWCAAFTSYVAKEAGLKCKYSVSAAGFANQFERIPVEREDEVRQGDIVIFNWNGRTDTDYSDHVGIVEWATIGQDGKFGTIEGNTTDTPGGKVARVTRDNNSYYFTAFFRPKYDEVAASKPATTPTTAYKKARKLYGIDVSSNQPKNICSLVKLEFAIVKMSGNPQGYTWNYVNGYAAQQMKDALKKTECVGLYHFTWGKDAETEAKFFLNEVKKLGYLGKSMLVIDYEAEAVELGRAWVKKFADYIKRQTGQEPVIYASGSVIIAQKLFELGYPIWCANYYKGYERIDGYDDSGCKIYSGCEDSVLWQYTSQGFIGGYDGALDCNVFFGTADDFKKLMGKAATSTESASTAQKPSTGATGTTTSKKPVKYRCSTDKKGKKWLSLYSNIERDGYSGQMNVPMRWFAMDGVKRYRVCTEESGWLPWIYKCDITDLENGCAGDGSPIVGVQVDDASCCYSVHVMNLKKWYADMKGLVDSGGSGDNFAGDLANRIDAFRAKRI